MKSKTASSSYFLPMTIDVIIICRQTLRKNNWLNRDLLRFILEIYKWRLDGTRNQVTIYIKLTKGINQWAFHQILWANSGRILYFKMIGTLLYCALHMYSDDIINIYLLYTLARKYEMKHYFLMEDSNWWKPCYQNLFKHLIIESVVQYPPMICLISGF